MDAHLFGWLANGLFAGAYLVRDVGLLRMLSIAGCACAALFQGFAPAEPLWVGVGWNALFVLVNARALLFAGRGSPARGSARRRAGARGPRVRQERAARSRRSPPPWRRWSVRSRPLRIRPSGGSRSCPSRELSFCIAAGGGGRRRREAH